MTAPIDTLPKCRAFNTALMRAITNLVALTDGGNPEPSWPTVQAALRSAVHAAVQAAEEACDVDPIPPTLTVTVPPVEPASAIEFQDIKEPGIFLRVDFSLLTAYSGTPEDPRVHVAVKIPDPSKIIFVRPAIETAMAMFAKEDEDGFEAALDKLVRGALHSAGHMTVTEKPEGDE